jgi:hypothetical protein
MTMVGAVLLRNPSVGYRPAGWTPAPTTTAVSTREFTPGEMPTRSAARPV